MGMVEDSRGDKDFQLGLGLDLNYRIIRTSPFSLGTLLSLPFDFHIRSDDGDEDCETHTVVLPIFSPRIGFQSEIMLSPKIDMVLRAEYCLASINLGDWTYSDEDDESSTSSANWHDSDGPEPEIDYSGGVVFTVGVRMLVFE